MKRVFLSVMSLLPLVSLIVAGVPPQQSQTTALCGTAPCSVTVTTTIADGNYPIGCIVGTDCLLNLIGGFAEATVQTNQTTIGASTSITTITNISGTFRYLGPAPGAIVFVTSNKFALRSGVWTTASRGAFKCKKSTTTPPVYNPASCSL